MFIDREDILNQSPGDQSAAPRERAAAGAMPAAAGASRLSQPDTGRSTVRTPAAPAARGTFQMPTAEWELR